VNRQPRPWGRLWLRRLGKFFWSEEAVAGKVIEFYIPANFKAPAQWRTERETGKVIEFPSETTKKSA